MPRCLYEPHRATAAALVYLTLRVRAVESRHRVWRFRNQQKPGVGIDGGVRQSAATRIAAAAGAVLLRAQIAQLGAARQAGAARSAQRAGSAKSTRAGVNGGHGGVNQLLARSRHLGGGRAHKTPLS
jgi:hypothetical protein